MNIAWAAEALSGENSMQDYYYMFPDRSIPDEYEKTLPRFSRILLLEISPGGPKSGSGS